MKKNIVIIHYNTPYVTECLVRSINLFVEDAVIYIFDNSDQKPFTAKFDNVTIIDNTKGKYIDFKKWLNKYPRRNASSARLNHWASAKHCRSIEKCMELIDENFILLDSDVLLKKDISVLFDDGKIFVGDIKPQPNSIERVLPYICFINTKMCKENGIHYFNENYMHGLHINACSDRYDTGSGFYIAAKNYPYEKIKYDEYVIHYGHGSWKKIGIKEKDNIEKWLDYYKKYWSKEKNKKVVYTCITGNYDKLLEPKYITNTFDYICFTDNVNLKSDIWEIKPLPKETKNLSQVKKQRYIKINAHKVLSEYDLSIWVDGNIEIKENLENFVSEMLINDCSIYVPKHPQRNCIYSESRVVISMKKDTSETVNEQVNRYDEEGFPKNYGLLQSGIILRKHNHEDCIKFMEEWFNELKDGSHRDQLSFNYIAWKNQNINFVYMDKKIFHSKWFNLKSGHQKSLNNQAVKSSKQSNVSIDKHKEIFNNIMHKKLSTHNVLIY